MKEEELWSKKTREMIESNPPEKEGWDEKEWLKNLMWIIGKLDDERWKMLLILIQQKVQEEIHSLLESKSKEICEKLEIECGIDMETHKDIIEVEEAQQIVQDTLK